MDICQITRYTLSEIGYETNPSETALICRNVEERIRDEYDDATTRILSIFAFITGMMMLILALNYVSEILTSKRR